MILFSFDQFSDLAGSLLQNSNFKRGVFQVLRHANQELYVRVETAVTDEECLIVGTATPPDEHLFEILALAHTLKKEGALMVTALMPYLAYTRHDKNKVGESLTFQLIGQLVKASGVDKVITLDIHSLRAVDLFSVPITSLSAVDLFVDIIRSNFHTATIVAPDEGALGRCEEIRLAAGTQNPVAYFKKNRSASGITQEGPIGEIGSTALIIDDMLDTGGTLVSTCKKLQEKGVGEITLMITHGLFTGEKWKELWSAGVRRIYCTNSVPTEIADDRIIRLSIAELISQSTSLIVSR